MKKCVLVTGSFGYIGNALVQRLLNKNYKVIGIDNQSKTNWLNEMKSESAVPVISLFDKVRKLRKYGDYTHYTMDISKDVNKLKELFNTYNFDTIINLAQMPAAPYPHIDLEHATWTIQNNTIGTLNILHMMKDYCPDAHIIEIESMGTYNHAINTDIPEGIFQFEYNGRKSEPCLFPKQAGSLYHTTKVFNTYLMEQSYRWWGIKSTIINQGVVYGLWTPEIEESEIYSHFVYDSTFGTVVNRFIIQSLMNEPLTVYGKGDQKRGYLALNDSVQCLMLFIENPAIDFRCVNQFAEVFSVNDIAKMIKDLVLTTEISYMDSPRVENTEDFYYNVSTDTLKKLGFKNTRNILDELTYLFDTIKIEDVNILKENFIKWN